MFSLLNEEALAELGPVWEPLRIDVPKERGELFDKFVTDCGIDRADGGLSLDILDL